MSNDSARSGANRIRLWGMSLFGLGITAAVAGGCSDPVPPSAEAALTTTIQSSGACTTARGPLSVGEQSALLSDGNPGAARVTNGSGGAKVVCTVAQTQTGYHIEAEIDADALEGNGLVPYHQVFNLTADYPTFQPGFSATASISGTDTQTQTSRLDGNCTLNVTSLGTSGDGGALFANFTCANFTDPNTPTSVCRLVGTVVLENCRK